MIRVGGRASLLRALLQAIVGKDATRAHKLLAASPELAFERARQGASRQTANANYFDDIEHYLYAGDTALHIAAAAYQEGIAQQLLAAGANVRAKNRRGAEPLHYAADGLPGSRAWNPQAQKATIACLILAGADPNAVDRNGATPLHRAVRTRCATAVQALLEGGANLRATNNSGSTPMLLATRNTGRGGAGSVEARAQQEQIVRLLTQHADLE